MSTDADRIEFTCPTCGAQHNRGYVNGVDTFRCLKCGYVGPRDVNTAPSSPMADRIAQLTADLFARDNRISELTEAASIARAELTKSGHEHAVMRQRLERTQAELSDERQTSTFVRETARMASEQRDAAQADAAAMREALSLWLKHYSHGPVVLVQLGRAALAGTAGRALAVRLPLWRELEEEMRTATKGKSLKQLLRILQGVRQDDHLLAVLSILYKLEDLAALDAKGGG